MVRHGKKHSQRNRFKKHDNGKYVISTATSLPVKGLHNLGNTCYFNASIQCLSRSPSFLSSMSMWSSACQLGILKRPDGPDSVITLSVSVPKLSSLLTESFCDLLTTLTAASTSVHENHSRNISKQCRNVLNPGPLRTSLLDRYPKFKGFGQQDSHELLRALLDGLKHEDLCRWQRGIILKLGVDPKSVDDATRKTVKAWGVSARTSTIIDRLFGGIIVSSLQCCVCGTIRHGFEPFLDLSLPLAPSRLKPRAQSTQLQTPNDPTKMSSSTMKSKHGLFSRKTKEKRSKRARRAQACVQTFGDNCLVDTKPRSTSVSSDNNCNDCIRSDGENVEATHGRDTEGSLELLTEGGKAVNDSNPASPVLSPNEPSEQERDSSLRNCKREGSELSTGSCADSEESYEETDAATSNAFLLDPFSRHSTCVTHVPSLSEQFSKLQLDSAASHDEGLQVSSSEMIQASKLAQSPLCVAPSTHSYDDANGPVEDNLEACLARFTSSEEMVCNNRIACEVCSKSAAADVTTENVTLQDAVKRDLILQPPPLLTIHIKRFQQVGMQLKKSQQRVRFPLLLDLSPYCSALSLLHANRVLYRLYGVVEHIGRLSGGHYVAYVAVDKNPEPSTVNEFIGPMNQPRKWPLTHFDLVLRLRRCSREQLLRATEDSRGNKAGTQSVETTSLESLNDKEERLWFHCSDAHVTEVKLSDVLGAQAFMLFYERVQ